MCYFSVTVLFYVKNITKLVMKDFEQHIEDWNEKKLTSRIYFIAWSGEFQKLYFRC